MPQLTIGDKAPAFSLKDQHGHTVKLSQFKGRKLVVYFYPKADTPGCTKQACGLRDVMPKVGDTVVLGISPDKPAKQKKFDVWTEKSMYGRKYMGILRSAFLIDEKGKIEQAWYKVSPQDTASNLLKAIA